MAESEKGTSFRKLYHLQLCGTRYFLPKMAESEKGTSFRKSLFRQNNNLYISINYIRNRNNYILHKNIIEVKMHSLYRPHDKRKLKMGK